MSRRIPIRRALAAATVITFYAGLAAVAIDKSVDQGSVATGAGVLAPVAGPDATGATVAPGAGSGAGTDVTTAPVEGDASSAVGADAGRHPATTTGAVDGAGATAPATDTTAPPGGATSSATGGAVAGGTIVIGVHDADPGAAFAQFGVRGPSSHQGEWVAKVAAWINANGGMGGRRLQIVHHVTQSLNGGFDQQAEQACVAFTEDNKVTAVVGGAQVPTLNLVDCLARHGTPLIWNYQFMADKAAFDRYADYLYMPSMPRAERLGVWVDALADDGFLRGGTIGIVRYDTAIHRAFVDGVVKPRLAANGATVREEVAFRPATGAASAADLSAQANNAILRFQASGVNRVFFAPTSAVLPLLFFAAAEAQGYRPKYTMTGFDIPAFQADNAPAAQLDGAKAFGWTPAGDVAWPQQAPLNGAAQRCVDITKGADPPGNGSARRYCDGLLFLKHLFDRGAEPTAAGIRHAVDALGASYESAWTLRTTMGPGRHDGASAGRLVTFGGACRCWAYSGPERPIP